MEILASSFLFYAIFLNGLIIRNIYMKIIGTFFPVFLLLWMNHSSKGFDWEDHSQGNLIIAEFFLLFYIAITFYFYVIIKLYLTKRKIAFWAVIVLSLLLFLYLLFSRVIFSCSSINKGLVPGFEIDDNMGECEWKKAALCFHPMLFGLLKPVYWGRSSCKSQKSEIIPEYEKLF